MKAIVLAGNGGSALFPLANYLPKFELPVAGEKLALHQLDFLKSCGFREVVFVFSSGYRLEGHLKERLERYRAAGVAVSCVHEIHSRGTAGSLKNLEEFIGKDDFLVLSGNLFIDGFDIRSLREFHARNSAGVTVVVERRDDTGPHLENLEVDGEGIVRNFHSLHRSRCKRRILRPVGLYLFRSGILDHVYDEKYMDIKEQLIPELCGKNIPVCAYEQKESVFPVNTYSDYVEVNRALLFNKFSRSKSFLAERTETKSRIWVGKNTRISPGAYLLGPVVIGDNCVIGEGSQVIGPACIDDDCRVGSNALVRESILWRKASLEDDSAVEYGLIGNGCTVPRGETVVNAIVLGDAKFETGTALASGRDWNVPICSPKGISGSGGYPEGRRKRKLYLAGKRMLDVVLSSAALLALWPLMLLISFAIKTTSRGPVLFRQRRCGLNGKEFTMYKFRTMHANAEHLQNDLQRRNNVDGPVFKLEDDPRITKLGRYLRKTSLDEIPQFLNVLRGDMSLVGPRPLVMEEMKFAPNWRDIRLLVKPGITGLWQINGRGNVSFHDWIRHDIQYVADQSMRLDIATLRKTVYKVIRGIGAV